MDEILGEFVAETLETLELLSGEVVAWERDPADGARLDAFFRFFHTVKGSCGFLDLPRFERLAHAAEDVLAAVRRGERMAGPATVSAVLAIMDRIGALARSAGEGRAPDIAEADDDRLIDALHLADEGFELFEPAAPRDEASAAPVAEAAAPPAGPPRRAGAPRSIRLPLALIDQLMNGISDMVLARNDLARRMREHGVDPELESSFERLSANVADLRDMISKTRMQRIDRLYAAMPRLVRDLSRELGRKVALELDGGDVEMDREMIEMVLDPLTHIVRNALDHGIEPPAERRAAGKAETGTLRLVARQSGNQIMIEVSDDGRGIDRAAVFEKAVAAGLRAPGEAALMSEADLLALVFHPGLSTAERVTAVSGRGVGMDVVRANIEQIGGVIGIDSKPGRGTTITLRVPLTLTIIPGLIVRAGGHCLAMPRGNVVELLHENSAMVAIEAVGGARIATIRGERHSLVDLEDVLGLDRAADAGPGPRTLMVVRASAGRPYVLGVASVESNEELVIRPASPIVAAAGLFAGMTLPDNGQPMLLLDAAGIAQVAGLPLRDAERHEPARPAAIARDDGAPTIQTLMYRERDGALRLMPLGVIDRVEDLAAGQIARAGESAFARIGDRLLPALNAQGEIGPAVTALRLHDGRSELCYLIGEVLDIVTAPARIDVALAGPRVAGLVLVGAAHYEMIDPFAIFAEAAHAAAPAPERAIRCHIADADDPWMRNILATLLVQAGHSVSIGEMPETVPDVILCGESVPAAAVAPAPVLVLSADRAVAGAIDRYDRPGLMAAIARAARSAA